VEYGFSVLGLHRIELRAAPSNIGSVRVAEKVGFTREGMLRHGARGADGWHDVEVFGLLASDERPSFHLADDYRGGL
jgi:RimJ/RimL family protein N-acetyltransferase